MPVEFRLPSLGADMESATLTEWLKQPGEAVRRGEALAVVETEKGLIDLEAFVDGTVTALLVAPGTRVPVGTVLAELAATGEPSARAAAAAAIAPAAIPAPAAPVPAAVRTPIPAAGAPRTTAVRLSPAARRRAAELGIDPATLAQHAPGGILHIADVERLGAASRPAQAARDAMRGVIGSAMARSKREIPHYYLGHSVDFGAARDWLQRRNAGLPVQERLVEGLLVARAVALAAARVAGFSGHFREGRFEPAAAVHLGVAIAMRGGGLVAPALLDADRKDLHTLMREFSDLVQRVRAGRMRMSEFTAATITLTSLGEEGVEVLYPIINPPQVAIVGAGRVTERPWVHEGRVSVRPVLALTLAADHRVSDGRLGSRFLQAVAALLADPESLDRT